MTSAISEIAAYAGRVLSSVWRTFLDGSAVYGACMAGLPPPDERRSDTATDSTTEV